MGQTNCNLKGLSHLFIACSDAISERLTTQRRLQDAGEPECSISGLRILVVLGSWRGAEVGFSKRGREINCFVTRRRLAAARKAARRAVAGRPSAPARINRYDAAMKFVVLLFVPTLVFAQSAASWTAAEDHRNMMDQLGIKALRPGPSGNENAPNHANYDEATANPYPNLPDPLTLKNGKKVATAKMWWDQRRPEIVEDFEREVVGRVPKNAPAIQWSVARTAGTTVGTYAVQAKKIVGHADNSAYPDINVDIQMALVVPAGAKGPLP